MRLARGRSLYRAHGKRAVDVVAGTVKGITFDLIALANAGAGAAKALMLDQPAMIRRPLVEAANGDVQLGFDADALATFVAEHRA